MPVAAVLCIFHYWLTIFPFLHIKILQRAFHPTFHHSFIQLLLYIFQNFHLNSIGTKRFRTQNTPFCIFSNNLNNKFNNFFIPLFTYRRCWYALFIIRPQYRKQNEYWKWSPCTCGWIIVKLEITTPPFRQLFFFRLT